MVSGPNSAQIVGKCDDRSRYLRAGARPVKALFILALAVLATACATPPTHYAWGYYEDLIYYAQALPESRTPQAQAHLFEKNRAAARAAHKPLPPGWHAHLSSLYVQIGRADLAREELLAEKAEFPESTTFVNRLLANLAASSEQPQ